MLCMILLSVAKGTGDKPMVEVAVGNENKVFSPEEVSAMVSFILELKFY